MPSGLKKLPSFRSLLADTQGNAVIYFTSKRTLNICLLLGLAALVSPVEALTNSISLSPPSNGPEYSNSETITITAQVSDSDGINSVRFWLEGGTFTERQLLGLLNDPPFTLDVTGLAVGDYTLYTFAKDNGDPQETLESNRVDISIIQTGAEINSVAINAEGEFAFTFVGAVGGYVLESSETLSEDSWVTHSEFTSNGTPMNFTETLVEDPGHWFFRIKEAFGGIDLPVDQTKLEVGPMVGHVTATTANLWVRPQNTSNVDVFYYRASDTQAASKVMSKAESDDKAYRTTVTGLSPSTNYYYDVVVDDNKIIGSGSFKTAPLLAPSGHQYSFALTSCAHRGLDPVQTGWLHMQNTDPDFVLFLGDTIYNNSYTLSQYQSSNRGQKEVGHFANIIKDVPIYTTWDDHDFGGNDSHEDSSRGGVPGSTLKNISLNAFKDAWANPYAGGPSNGVYYDFSWGDVDFFVLDNRYHRTATHGTAASRMLGDVQLQWLKDKLSASTATFKIICQGGSYNGVDGAGFEGYPTEFQGLRAHVINNSIDGILFMSGDVHNNQIRYADTGNKNFGYPVWDIIASGIGRENLKGRWAKIDIDTTIPDPTLKVTFYEQGTPTRSWGPNDPKDFIPEVIDYTLKLSDLQN